MPKSNLSSKPCIFVVGLILFLVFVLGTLDFAQAAIKSKKTFLQRLKAQIQEQTQGEEEPVDEYDRVSQEEIKNALEELSRQKQDVRKFLRKAAKLKDAAEVINGLNALAAEIDQHIGQIKNPSAIMTQSEAVRAFWDARLWEELDPFRSKIELPQEIKSLMKDVNRIKKMLRSRNLKKIDPEIIESAKSRLAEVDTLVTNADKFLQEGEYEDARSELEEVYNDHPGNIDCALHFFRETNDGLRRIRDAKIKDLMESIVEPVKEAVKAGDWREACETINEVKPKLEEIMSAILESKRRISPALKNKLEQLEELIRQKFENMETGTMPMPQPVMPENPILQ